MAKLTRFSVAPLATMTRRLADVASGRGAPDLVITGRARALDLFRAHPAGPRDLGLGRAHRRGQAGRHAQGRRARRSMTPTGGIIAPGLVDPHIHIESRMVTACAYAEAALLNGTTTIFCDSHEIGNVMDVAGVEAMLEDAREAPLSIFLTVP